MTSQDTMIRMCFKKRRDVKKREKDEKSKLKDGQKSNSVENEIKLREKQMRSDRERKNRLKHERQEDRDVRQK